MVTVELSPDELEFLLAQLRGWLVELQTEILDTDSPSFKADLKEDRTRAMALLLKFRESARMTAAV